MATISSKIPRLSPISAEEKKILLQNNRAANFAASKQAPVKVKVDEATQSLADSVLKKVPTSHTSKIPRPINEINPHADLDLLWDELESKPYFSDCGTKHLPSTQKRNLPAGYRPIQYGQGLQWDPEDVKPHKEAKENPTFFQKISFLNQVLALSKKYAEPKPSQQDAKEAFLNDAINIMKQFSEAKKAKTMKDNSLAIVPYVKKAVKKENSQETPSLLPLAINAMKAFTKQKEEQFVASLEEKRMKQSSLAIVPYKACSANKKSEEKGFTPSEKILLTTLAALAAIYFLPRERN